MSEITSASENDLRKIIKEGHTRDTLQARLEVLMRFAEERNLEHKEEHVFATIIQGINAAVQMEGMLKGKDVSSLPIFNRVKNNVLSVEEARQAIREAVRTIAHRWGDASVPVLKEIWQRESQIGEVRENVSWVGGGDVLSYTLGEGGKPFDPFE